MSNADKNTNAVMATREYRELAAEFAALQKERDALKAQLDKAGAGTDILADMALLAEMAYESYNRDALSGGSDPLMAPTGQEAQIRPHLNFVAAFRSLLDGVDEALNGYRNGNYTHRGLRENARYFHQRLAEIVADKGALFTSNGAPVTEDAGKLYDRWLEVAELTKLVEALESGLLRAYDNADTGDSEGYVPKSVRIANSQKDRKAREQKAEAVSAKMDAILANAPKLDLGRRAG